ncbi:hypothetical protein ACHAQJ_007590 [Trichoderma viride]
MPMYDVQCSLSLSKDEKDKIAKAITRIHTTTFTVPSLFVNVQFTNLPAGSSYQAGEERKANRIIAFLRGGPRTREQFIDVTKQIKQAWDDILNNGKGGEGERQIGLIAVLDGLAGGLENGFVVPAAGEDIGWLSNHKAEFEKLAAAGNPDFIGLLHEMETREDLVAKISQNH